MVVAWEVLAVMHVDEVHEWNIKRGPHKGRLAMIRVDEAAGHEWHIYPALKGDASAPVWDIKTDDDEGLIDWLRDPDLDYPFDLSQAIGMLDEMRPRLVED